VKKSSMLGFSYHACPPGLESPGPQEVAYLETIAPMSSVYGVACLENWI